MDCAEGGRCLGSLLRIPTSGRGAAVRSATLFRRLCRLQCPLHVAAHRRPRDPFQTEVGERGQVGERGWQQAGEGVAAGGPG
eukprot:3224638-Pyramimonas_sp.AAC.1